MLNKKTIILFRVKDYNLTWVDDTHVLAVFSSQSAGNFCILNIWYMGHTKFIESVDMILHCVVPCFVIKTAHFEIKHLPRFVIKKEFITVTDYDIIITFLLCYLFFRSH